MTSRRRLLIGLAGAASLPGCLFTPPVRPENAFQGREPVDRGITDQMDRLGAVFREALRRSFGAERAEQAAWVDALPRQDRAVAWEATAMAVAWLQRRTGSDQSWQALVDAQGPEQDVALALGLGWALSWLAEPTEGEAEQLEPLVRWRILDGYGFRDGLVAPRRFALRGELPPQIRGADQSTWRHGLGRSLWYTSSADVGEVCRVIARFPPAERAELWTGLGVAATWIGSVRDAPMRRLADAAGDGRAALALGAAIAARTCRDGNTLTERQRAPCAVLAGATPEVLVSITDAAEAGLPGREGELPHVQLWMNGIASRLS